MRTKALLPVAISLAALAGPAAHAIPAVPPGFQAQTVATGLTRPVGLAFAPDGRIFICEQRGVVRVWQGGSLLPAPFIDLQGEIQNGQDRGLLGIALDPEFLTNRHVYLLYTVDPVAGQPDSALDIETFSRLTRYTGTAASNGNEADLATRTVIIGVNPSEGIPSCHSSHTIGTLLFGQDGSLFVGAGDGAHFDFADAGGSADQACFQPPLFSSDQNVGAFRAQYLDSTAGKVLRIDPATGGGLSSNPYYNGDPSAARSRVWVYGLRNEFRFGLRPGTPGPGTLYIGDVGWNTFEEINVARGLGENFGWPCREGLGATPQYPGLSPAHSGCATIGTAANPGPLTGPIVTWHHSSSAQSTPPQTGFAGRAAVGGVFYSAAVYPVQYRGGFFFADHVNGWIRVLKTNAQDQFVALLDFATATDSPVSLTTNPVNGDVYYVALFAGEVRRIKFFPGDLNGDFHVDGLDLALLLAAWGRCPAPPALCLADVSGDGVINGMDLAALLAAWGS